MSANENWSPSARGSKCSITTVNIGATTATQKILVDDEVNILTTLNIGTAPDNYIMPSTSLGVADKSVLSFNATTKNMEFKFPACMNFQMGGNINTLLDYAVPSGDPNLATNSTLDASKEVVAPYGASIQTVTYSTINGDATSVLSIWKNGSSITTIPMTGASGFYNLPSPVAMVAGDRIAVRLDSGTLPNASHILLFASF